MNYQCDKCSFGGGRSEEQRNQGEPGPRGGEKQSGGLANFSEPSFIIIAPHHPVGSHFVKAVDKRDPTQVARVGRMDRQSIPELRATDFNPTRSIVMHHASPVPRTSATTGPGCYLVTISRHLSREKSANLQYLKRVMYRPAKSSISTQIFGLDYSRYTQKRKISIDETGEETQNETQKGTR